MNIEQYLGTRIVLIFGLKSNGEIASMALAMWTLFTEQQQQQQQWPFHWNSLLSRCYFKERNTDETEKQRRQRRRSIDSIDIRVCAYGTLGIGTHLAVLCVCVFVSCKTSCIELEQQQSSILQMQKEQHSHSRLSTRKKKWGKKHTKRNIHWIVVSSLFCSSTRKREMIIRWKYNAASHFASMDVTSYKSENVSSSTFVLFLLVFTSVGWSDSIENRSVVIVAVIVFMLLMPWYASFWSICIGFDMVVQTCYLCTNIVYPWRMKTEQKIDCKMIFLQSNRNNARFSHCETWLFQSLCVCECDELKHCVCFE